MVAIGNGRLFFGSPTPATRRPSASGFFRDCVACLRDAFNRMMKLSEPPRLQRQWVFPNRRSLSCKQKPLSQGRLELAWASSLRRL